MFVNKRPCDWTAGLFLAWLQSPCVPSMNALNQKDLNWGGGRWDRFYDSFGR